MKRLPVIAAVFWIGVLWTVNIGASPLRYDFSLPAGQTFQGTAHTLDLGNDLILTLTATWNNPSQGRSGIGDVWQTWQGVGVIYDDDSNNNQNINGLGVEETLWLTFNHPVILTGLAVDSPHYTDPFDLLSGDLLVFSNVETVLGPIRVLGNGFTNTVFGIRTSGRNDAFFVDQIHYIPVPEGESLLLLGFGILVMAGYKRLKP